MLQAWKAAKLPSVCGAPLRAPAEDREPFRGNTIRVAAGLPHNGVLDRLLVVVASVKRCHSGEAFVRLKVCGRAAPLLVARREAA